MHPFRDLVVWQRGHQALLDVYRLTRDFPKEERYGLTSQLRRAALSVPNNVVEGSKKATKADFARFLNHSEGSAAETEYLLLVARDLGYMSADAHQKLSHEYVELSRMLCALRAKVAGE